MKRLKGSKSPRLPKQRSLRSGTLYLPAILFASLLGTYLDLYFVEKNFYAFPLRPFPEVFSINIVFTLIVLPLLTWIFLYLVDKMSRLSRLIFILFLSALVPFFEKKSIELGYLYQADQWDPLYSFIGYFLFFVLIWKVFRWGKGDR